MEIKLNKNGWYCRLQRYVFTNPPQYYNFCPMFWLTNFCILVTFILPVVPLIKLIVWLYKKGENGFESMADWIDLHYCQPTFDREIESMDPEEVLKSWALNKKVWFNSYSDGAQWQEYDFWVNTVYRDKLSGRCDRDKILQKFEAWKTKHENWQDLLEDYKKKRIANREQYLKDLEETREKQRLYEIKREESIKKSKERRQAAFSFIANYTKWIFYGIAGFVICFVLYWLYRLGVYAVEHFHYGNFIKIMKNTGWGLLFLSTVFIIIFALVKILSKVRCNFCISDSKFGRAMCKFLSKIREGLFYAAIKVGEFFSFFWEYIVVTKKDYCPGIVWQEEKTNN